MPATGQTKCYDDMENEIPCESAEFPGQDGLYQAKCPIEGRFTDNLDGTVTDNCTGLMWQKDHADVDGDGSIGEWPEDVLTWQGALKYCENLRFAGYSDWRLPNVREIESLVDHGDMNIAIDGINIAINRLFGVVRHGGYWSSSTSTYSKGEAWNFNPNNGAIGYFPKDSPTFVRAVRTIQPGE